METTIDWFPVGKEFSGSQNQKDRILEIIGRVQWQPVQLDTVKMGIMQGYAIEEAVKHFKIPKVSHVADSHELAPFGLICIRGHYVNDSVDLFFVDKGDILVPVCAQVSYLSAAINEAPCSCEKVNHEDRQSVSTDHHRQEPQESADIPG